jgi:glyoxylase-like metal-dependent hydrolase (beta-lactamase superfamily II)
MVSPQEPIAVEIGEDTWRLQGRVGPRNVYQYLVASADRDELLLIDTGTAETPREVVLPALRRLGLAASDLRLVVVTHPDVDHQGGLAGLREACENALAACGFADRAMVGDPEKLLADRYGCYVEHALGMTADEIRWVRANYGARVEIDVTFSGGESLQIGERRLVVLPAPGHSAGHLVLFEPETGLLFSSDAVHWRACPAADGSPALCPTYEEVDDYMETIDLVESLAPSEMHSGHWPMRSGREVITFLDESRRFVAAVDAVLRARLAQPATLAELCQEVQLEAGPWDSGPAMLRFVVSGHVRRLLRVRAVEVIEADPRPPPRYRLSPDAQPPNRPASIETGSRPT